MNTLREIIADIFANKRRLILSLLVGIAVLAIPVSLQLVRNQQILKSRASGGPEDGKYVTINGTKSLAQMRQELINAGWASDLIGRSTGEQILELYDRNRSTDSSGNSFNCVVNFGDANNMSSTLQTAAVGQEVRVTIIAHLSQQSCNTWFYNPRFTNVTTGHKFGDWHPVGIGDVDSANHVCRNGRDPFIGPPGSAHGEYEGAGRYDQGNPFTEASACFFAPPEPGHYIAEIALGSRQDANGACNLPPDPQHESVGLYAKCEFDVVAQPGQTPPSGSGGSGGPGSNGSYTVAGHIKDASGNPASGVSVQIYDDVNKTTKTVTTGSDGSYSIADQVKNGDVYAVRIPDGKAHAVGGDHTFIAQLGIDTPAGNASYEFQSAGNNDCSGPGFNNQSGRCDFTYNASSSSGNVGVGTDCTLGANKNECPLPAGTSSPQAGTVSCNSNNVATFSWSPFNYPGKTVSSYEVRINAAPAGWGPDTTTPAMTAVTASDPNAGPDRIISVPASSTSVQVQLNPGQYLDWVARAHFTDGTLMNVDSMNGHWGAWNCPSSGTGGPSNPSSSPSQSPTSSPSGSGIVTDTVKIVEDDTRNTIPVNDPIWDNPNLVTTKPYSQVASNPIDFTFHDTVCVTTPCDTFPSGDRWVHVLFIGHDAAGNPLKKVEDNHIYVALKPKIDSISCTVSPSGGTAISITGSHFGNNMGSIKLGNQNADPNATTWSNLNTSTTFSNQIDASNQTITLTTPEGLSDTGQCALNKSLIDFTASLSCRSASRPLQNAYVEVKDASSSASIFKQDNLGFDANGRPQGLQVNLAEGKAYKLIIQPQYALRKVISFTAQKGTTVLQALNLPLGDIAPEKPDCTINSNDISRLYSEWATVTDASQRRGDLIQHGRVNSLDYACMRSNFGQSCDPLP